MLFSPCSFSQALDPALQLVSRDHLLGNVPFSRELHIFLHCWIESCPSIRSGICHPGVPAELWEVWVWRVVAMGTKQCPALHGDTRTHEICFPRLKDTNHQKCDPSPGNKTAQETPNCTEKSLLPSCCLFPRRRPSSCVGFPLGSSLRCSAAKQIRAVLELSFSQMCDPTLTHSQNSFSFREPPLWSGKMGLFPELEVWQPACKW